MELPLLYPLKDLKTIDVGILSMKIIKIMSNQQMLVDGSLPYQLILSVARNANIEQIKKLSLIDANRIMMAAWRQTHSKEKYIAKQYCGECKKLVIIEHDTNIKYERPKIHDDAIEIMAKDPVTLQDKTYTVILRPIPLSLQSDLIKNNDNVEEITELLIWCRIKSIDGKEDFDKENVPLVLYNQLTELTDDEVENVTTILRKTKSCVCGEEVESVLSWTDSTFLQGK
jgi:hypothetical protein